MDSAVTSNSPSKSLTLDKIQILNLFKLFDNLPFDPKNENETWYIVNKEFIDSLKSYEEGKASRYQTLIDNRIFVEDASNVTTRTRLLKDYENGNGVNFLLYPEKAIDVLEKHFHFNLKIPRAVYPYKVPKREKVIYKVDIQPLKIVVYSKNPNDFSSPSKMKIVVLRNDTVEDVLREIVTDFDPASFKKNLFYAEEMSGKKEYNWERLYLHDSTEYPLNKKIHEYDIDDRTCFLITNERADIKCLTNESDYAYTRREASFRRSEKEEDCMRGYSSGRTGGYASTTHTLGYTQENMDKQISYIFEHGGDRGLINLGNTCFLNSSLQCLAKIKKFSNYFLSGTFWNHINYSNPVGQNGRLAKAYYETLLELWKINKRSEPYAPKALKLAISEKRDEFYGYQQHDSQELLAFLLDGLHEDLNLIQKKPYYEEKLQGGLDKLDIDVAEASWNRHKEINNSIIVDLFQGQYRSRLQCPQCKKVSIAFDPFMYLSIPLPPKKNHRIWFHVILNRDVPIGMRFSCSFSGSQEVLKLKIFLLTIIKNLKVKRKNILLHNKCIIKNSKETVHHEGRSNNHANGPMSSSSGSSCSGGTADAANTSAFNFHQKYLDEKNEFYEDNEDNCTNADIANYVRAIKNKNKIRNTLKEQDICILHESICAMCNIQSIEELEINNLSFLFTKFKNLACNQFFQVLNNTDFVTEPHTRNGKGISHIFVFILPKLYAHLIDKNMDVKVPDESLEVLTNSTVTTNNTSLRDEEMNLKNETNHTNNNNNSNSSSNNNGTSEKKAFKEKSNPSSKILKKRKGLLSSPNNNGSPIRKGEKIYPPGAEEDEDDEVTPMTSVPGELNANSHANGNVNGSTPEAYDEAMEESNDLNMQDSSSEMPLYNSNGIRQSRYNCQHHISYNELLRDRIISTPDVYNLHDKYFSLLIVPLCKDEQLFYKMKNNDLPLLLNIPFNFTLNDLYSKVENAYRKEPLGNSAPMEFIHNSNDQNNQPDDKNPYGEVYTHNGNVKSGGDEESAKKDSISSTDVTNKTITNEYDRVLEEKGNPNGVHMEENGANRFTLYLSCYNLKEEWTPKDNLGFELKRDETYLSDYIKNSEEKRLIIIHLNSVEIDYELSLDIKTMTFIDLEERYGIDTCLKLFSEEEHLDENNTWYCGNCKLHVQAYKKLDLFRMPIILILHLKRFNNTNRWLRTKIDSYVYYPHKENEYLDMAPYILEDGLKHMIKMDPTYSPLYELIGVNCHTGGLCGGHYFAYVKLNGQWYNFNDTFVTTIEESQVNTKDAYLLFYQLHTHKNETFTGVADQRNLAEEEAIRMANASYYN